MRVRQPLDDRITLGLPSAARLSAGGAALPTDLPADGINI
jgi:hypothetical protein